MWLSPMLFLSAVLFRNFSYSETRDRLLFHSPFSSPPSFLFFVASNLLLIYAPLRRTKVKSKWAKWEKEKEEREGECELRENEYTKKNNELFGMSEYKERKEERCEVMWWDNMLTPQLSSCLLSTTLYT